MIKALHNGDLNSDKIIFTYSLYIFLKSVVPDDGLLLGRNMSH